MNGLNSSRENFLRKKQEALTKLNAFRENFERKKKEGTEAGLEETGKIWKEVSERFEWWQRQELP